MEYHSFYAFMYHRSFAVSVCFDIKELQTVEYFLKPLDEIKHSKVWIKVLILYLIVEIEPQISIPSSLSTLTQSELQAQDFYVIV